MLVARLRRPRSKPKHLRNRSPTTVKTLSM
ncbi:hypothetical protein J0S82_002573 [Galemys pyrenaicus]|uniref:Uncharacterized protein n=1 Tax=Galemys pyrenaicus TaxID=202257 RepID=A0A8J6DMF1_GALPY|nr:hypothetical protein J0S82_002573 [Galemys pyrenaicus]